MVSMPTARDVKPFIGSFDFDASRDFYVAVGWNLNCETKTVAELELGGCRFNLQRYYNKTWCENLMLHITVDDAQAWYEHVRTVIESNSFPSANEAEPRVYPPKREEDRSQLVTYAWDPAGVLLHFAQPLHPD